MPLNSVNLTMIPTKTRENRRKKLAKTSKNIERLYREGKCRECSVVVTQMDFAKILGKFTKVKIQYENITNNNSKPAAKSNRTISPNIINRLKSNENGMVLLHRNAYNRHPVKALNCKKENENTKQSNNILKENNRLKKSPIVKDGISNHIKKPLVSSLKQYGIIFVTPTKINNNDTKIKISLGELLPIIDDSILPSVEWCIDYFPKNEEPKEDKVYDRIAAELEDLMYNEKKPEKSKEKTETTDNKVDDFPSIMDILNDNTSENVSKDNDQMHPPASKPNLESSDVEAMLLGKSNANAREMEVMDVDCTISNLLNVSVMHGTSEDNKVKNITTDAIDNPQSPSILDEAMQKGIEEHLPMDEPGKTVKLSKQNITKALEKPCEISKTTVAPMDVNMKLNEELSVPRPDTVTHVIFKKTVNGKCIKSVTCPKNLKYSIELEEKCVELIGAPRFISSLEDLQVLLQIVNESKLNSFYVLH